MWSRKIIEMERREREREPVVEVDTEPAYQAGRFLYQRRGWRLVGTLELVRQGQGSRQSNC